MLVSFWFSERILDSVFFHRHVHHRRHTGRQEPENIPEVSADVHVPLHDTTATCDGTDDHEQLTF